MFAFSILAPQLFGRQLGSSGAANTNSQSYGFNLGNLFGVQTSFSNANAAGQGGLGGSGANTQSITNGVNILGVPISHTISGSQSADSTGVAGGAFNQGFQLGPNQYNMNYAGGLAGNQLGNNIYGNPYQQQQYAQYQNLVNQGANFVNAIAGNVFGQFAQNGGFGGRPPFQGQGGQIQPVRPANPNQVPVNPVQKPTQRPINNNIQTPVTTVRPKPQPQQPTTTTTMSPSDLDDLIGILDQNTREPPVRPSTKTPDGLGTDYDLDVRIDEEDSGRAKRDIGNPFEDDEETTTVANIEGEEEEGSGLDNRFGALGGLIAQGIGQGLQFAGQALAGGGGGYYQQRPQGHNAYQGGYRPNQRPPPGGNYYQQRPGYPNQPQYNPNGQGQNQGGQRPQQGGYPQQPGGFGGSASNAQGIVQNQGGGFNQQSGANTHTSNVVNEHGAFQNTGGSSIAANLAGDGSSGQLSAANTQQSSQHTADGHKEQNSAQSQSTNFDNQGNLQASNAGTNVQSHKDKNGERVETNGQSSSFNKNPHGQSGSSANANTVQFNQNGVQGQQSNAQSQSQHQGLGGGGASGAQANANTVSFTGPFGFGASFSSASSSSFNHGGGGAGGSGASASAGSGSGFGGSGAQAGANAGNRIDVENEKPVWSR